MQTVTVFDSGPREPEKPAKPLNPQYLTDVEQEASRRYEQDRRDYEAWHKQHEGDDGPVELTMDLTSAKEAIARDPERYSLDDVAAHVPNRGLADRVTILERRLDELQGVVDENVVRTVETGSDPQRPSPPTDQPRAEPLPLGAARPPKEPAPDAPPNGNSKR